MFFIIAPALAETKNLSLKAIDQSAVIILAFGRIGDDYDLENNLSFEQFQRHITYIQKNGFDVISLKDLKKHEKSDIKKVVITFEGGYKSALLRAIPVLEANHIPFTVFYAADRVESGDPDFMTTEDLKKLSEQPGVTLGILPSGYSRLLDRDELEIRRQINKSITFHREHFGTAPGYFSYPYGEYNQNIRKIIESYDFKYIFGLHSGVFSQATDPLACPRYFLSDAYGDDDHFAMIMNTLPLPVINLEPQSPMITTTAASIGFTLHPEIADQVKNLQCFASDMGKPLTEILGAGRVELRISSFTSARTRLNCILPVILEGESVPKAWRWLGFLLFYSPDTNNKSPLLSVQE